MTNAEWAVGKKVGKEDKDVVSRGMEQIMQGLVGGCKELFVKYLL